MKRLALVPLLLILTVFALALTGGMASGGGSLAGFDSIEVAVNIEFDPAGHAEFIDTPESIKLTVQFDGDDVTISGPDPWVSVEGEAEEVITKFTTFFEPLDLGGKGTVAGFDNVEVGFTGNYDPGSPTGEKLTGFYTMGVRGSNTPLPGGQPIVYRIKPKPGGPPAPTATVPGMGAPDTPVPPPALTPTATVPGMGAPTDTPVPFDMTIVVKVDADTGLLMEGWEMKIFAGDGCTGSPILSGLTDSLTPTDAVPFSSGYFVLLPPGDYSVAETQQPGWERVAGTPFCQNFTQGESLVFRNRRIRNGDVNCDGSANAIDASLMLQLQADLVEQLECEAAGDTNEDGILNAIDTALVLQFTAGLIPGLPVGSGPTPNTPTPAPTLTPVASSTPAASPTTLPTATETPTATPTSNTGKISISVVGGPGRSISVHQGSGCTGSAFASLTVNGSLSLSFSPGSYSIMAGDVEGWELVEGVEACQDVDLTAGQKTDITFSYQVAGQDGG